MIRSSPALAMLARLKWLIKQSDITSARIRQRTSEGRPGAESSGGLIGARNSKQQTPNTEEAPNFKSQSERGRAEFEAWCLELLWSLVFGAWCFHPPDS